LIDITFSIKQTGAYSAFEWEAPYTGVVMAKFIENLLKYCA